MPLPASDMSRIGMAQHLLTFLRALPRPVRTPVRQNVAQVADGDVDRGLEIDLTIGTLCTAIFTQLVNLGRHAYTPRINPLTAWRFAVNKP